MSIRGQDSSKPERRITLLFIAVGSIFAFIATVLGALMLANMSGINIDVSLALFSAHPYLQIFGFLSLFVCGVGYSIIPLFKSEKIRNPSLAYVPFSLITTANILGIVVIAQGGSYYELLFQIISILILVSSAVFCYQILDVLGRPGKSLGEAGPFISMAAISFVLISIIFFLNSVAPQFVGSGRGDLFSAGFLYLSLIGFTGTMIFGVEIRTVVFRMTNYKKNIAKITAVLLGLSIALSFLSALRNLGIFGSIASVTFLLSAVCFGITIRIFESKKQSRILLPVTGGQPSVASHNAISDYTDVCVLSSVLWLLFGGVLGVVWQVFGDANFWITDSFIHSLAIGFIGSVITAYGPVLLPGVLSSKGPKKHLSLVPLFLLNAGLVLRVAGNFSSTLYSGALPVWESLSGLLIIGAMVMLLKNMHFRNVND